MTHDPVAIAAAALRRLTPEQLIQAVRRGSGTTVSTRTSQSTGRTTVRFTVNTTLDPIEQPQPKRQGRKKEYV